MAQKTLITGGAGFIGLHVASELLDRGHDVTILDSLIDQVHLGQGHVNGSSRPAFPDGAELVRGDVRDENAVRRALRGATHVVHLAAEVGVGQSMYAVERYVSANDVGTAVLMQEIARGGIERVVVASSMSIYGEGLYRAADGTLRDGVVRASAPGSAWDPSGPDGRPLVPVPTPETKPPSLASVYALSKFVQERMTLMLAEAYGIEGCALRLFNVYGPGQALSNPYTGVLAIFAARLLNGRPPRCSRTGCSAAISSTSPMSPPPSPPPSRSRKRPATSSTSAVAATTPSSTSPACSPTPWAARTSRPRCSARRVPATSATASPTSRSPAKIGRAHV